MNRRTWNVWLLGFSLVALLSSPSRADWFADDTTDGYLHNFGVTIGLGATDPTAKNTYAFDPAYDSSLYPDGTPLDTHNIVGSSTGFGPDAPSGMFNFNLEDTHNENGSPTYVGPYHGAQDYDAEFLGVAREGDLLYIGISSGMRPDNGSTKFGIGDVLVTVNDGVGGTYYLGVEVGGGAGGGAGGLVSLADNSPGSTYTLNSSGFTTAHTASASQYAGSVWSTTSLAADWVPDPISDGAGNIHYTQLKGGTQQADAESYLYTANTYSTVHSVIEIVLDLSKYLEDGEFVTSITFSPGCSNDVLTVEPPESSTIVPVPSSLVLLGSCLGTLALIGASKRRRRQAA